MRKDVIFKLLIGVSTVCVRSGRVHGVDLDQLWAEAAAAEAQGESIRLAKELWAIAECEQKEATEENLFVEVLATALGDFEGRIPSADVWLILGLAEPRHRNQRHNEDMGDAMRELGWVRDKQSAPTESHGGCTSKATARR